MAKRKTQEERYKEHIRKQQQILEEFAARIRALRNKDQGRQTVPEQWRGNGAASRYSGLPLIGAPAARQSRG
jgi:hypothetical protein